MRTNFIGFALTAFLIALAAFGQPPSPTDTPVPTPAFSATPASTPMLVSTTPTPTPSPAITATMSPSDVGTVSVPTSLNASPIPSPSAPPIGIQAAALGQSSLGWSERGAPVFSLEQAVITAL